MFYRFLFLGGILFSFLFLCSCEKDDSLFSDEKIDTESPDYQKGIEITLQRARQITDVQWSPLAKIPRTRPEGKFYEPGKTYKGIPYSSVKEMSKFVGQDVSIHTFLSAVSNPRSVLYTEFVNQAPYHGVNCAPYYGIVCSMSVNYALGIESPIISRYYSSAHFMQKVTDYDVDLIKVCDVLASQGHTIMAVKVLRDDADRVKEVQFLENSYYISFTREELQEYWSPGKFVLYRYKDMAKNIDCPKIEPVVSNPSLCPDRGDKSVYRTDERVVINVLDDSYEMIELYLNGNCIERKKIVEQDVVFENLPEGLYSACLKSEGKESEYTYFEICSASIKVTNNNTITVSFGLNTIPAVTVELCNISGGHLYTRIINDKERTSGQLTMNKINKPLPYYCKVIFQGKYGKIPSKYVIIEK